MNTAQILRTLRCARNLSQEEIAKELGIDRTTYVKYENGGSIKRSLPRLADFFHVSTDYLLGRESAGYPTPRTEVQALHDAPVPYAASPAPPSLTRHDALLMRKYHELKPEHQKAVDIQVNYFYGIDSGSKH